MKKPRRRGFLSSAEGLAKLDERMCQKGYTQQSLAEEAQVSLDQVKKLLHPQWGRKIEPDAIRQIASILDLKPIDIIDPNEWYPLLPTSKLEKKLDEVFINEQNKKTFNPIMMEPLLDQDSVNDSFSLPSNVSDSTSENNFGEEDDPCKRNFSIGSHVETNQSVCIDLDRFVESNSGVFGRSRSEQSSLTRLLLAGIIHKQAAVNLIFDLNSEYGWEAPRGGIYGKGLKQLFPNEVDIYTIDLESAQRRGLMNSAKELYISYDNISVEDIIAVRSELNVSDKELDTAIFVKHEVGLGWIEHLLLRKIKAESTISLYRKLMRLDELKCLRTHQRNPINNDLESRNTDIPLSGVEDIINSLKAGRHVVIDFGSSPNRLTYKLITNIITRRVHGNYIRQSEYYLGRKNKFYNLRRLVVTITEAERFLNAATINQTFFSNIIRDSWKSYATLLAVTRYPSRIDKEIMSEISTRIISPISDEDIDAALTGVTGIQNLRLMLSKLDSNKKALLFGDAVHRPVLVNIRPDDERFY